MKVVFSYSSGLPSMAIRLGTRSKWSHVDAVFDDNTLIGAVAKGVGGLPNGVQRTTLEQRLFHSHIVYYRIDEIVLADEKAAREFAEQQVGKSYDYTGAMGIALPGRVWNSEEDWFCSELIAAICLAGKVRVIRKPVYRVTPEYLDRCPLFSTLQATTHIR